jgi:hypothetical protein
LSAALYAEAGFAATVALGLVDPSEVGEAPIAQVPREVATSHLGEGVVRSVVRELSALRGAPADRIVGHGLGVVLGVGAGATREEGVSLLREESVNPASAGAKVADAVGV